MESLDTFRTVAFAADFASERLPPVTISGGDYRGRVFRLSLTDGGQPTEADGVLCRLGWNADPGQDLGSFVEAERVDGTDTATWEVEVPTSMLAQPRCKAAWMLYTAGSSNVLCTLAFDVAVERPVVDTGSAEGEDLVDRLWTAIDTMEQATDNANAATESAHRAADAAAEAAAMAQMGTNRLTAEATGELVNVSDAFPGTLLETKVYGKSEQVTTTGAQLLQLVNNDFKIDKNGVTTDSTPDVDNRSWNSANGEYASVALSAGQYFLRIEVIRAPTVASGGCSVYTNGVQWKNLSLSAPIVYNMELTAASGDVLTVLTKIYDGSYRVMLNAGSTALPWEPYSGGVASPSPEWPQPIESVSSAEVVTAGGNLIVPRVSPGHSETTYGVTFKVNGDYSVTLTGTTGSTKASFSIMGYWGTRNNPFATTGRDLFLSDSGSTSSDVAAYLFRNGAFNTGAYSGNKIVSDAIKNNDGLNVAIEVPTNTTVNETVRVMLNFGTAALPWSPVGTVLHPLDLQGHELRSLPDGTRDELVVNADGSYGIVQRVGHAEYDGSSDETWKLLSNNGFEGVLPATAKPTGNNITKIPSRCNVLSNAQSYYPEWYDSASDGYSIPGILTQAHLFFIRIKASTGIATLDDFLTWLAANPVTVDYVRAAETYVPLGTLDPAPSWPDEGVNNAWTVSDLPTETGVGYVQSVQIVHDRQEARLAALETAIATMEA